jgi:Helix-turn-helix domain
VWEHSRSRGPARLVLLAIADNAHDDGAQAWPSITTLVRKTGLAERTVQGSLKVLVKLGELDVDHNAGPRHCNLYRVLMPTPAPDAPPQEMHPAGDAGVQEMHPTPAGDAPPPPQEMHPEPSIEPSRNRQVQPARATRSRDAATVTPIPTAQTFVAAYINAYRRRAGHDPPSRVKGQVARHLREAFTDGIAIEHIKAGLVDWFDANQHPATLPSFIEVAGRGGRPRASPTRAQRQVDQARRTFEEMMANASGGVGADRGPPQPELARPADQHPDR